MERVFKDTFSIKSIGDCFIRISAQLCCRSTGANEATYVYTEFNRCLGARNASPVFNKPMPRLLNYNELDFIFYEPEDLFDQRDSISYSLLEPAYQANNVSITYSGNSSPKRPLRYTGFPNTPLKYSNSGGWIEVTPTQLNSVGYIGGDIYEWFDSSGTKILASKTHFDHIYIVTNNTTPTRTPQLALTGGGLGVNGTYDPCGDTVQHLNYILSDSGDSLSYFIRTELPITVDVVDTNDSYKNIRLTVNIPDSLINDTFYVRIYARDNNCTLAKERNFLIPFVRFPKPKQYTSPILDSVLLCNSYRLTLSDPAQQNLVFDFNNGKDTQTVFFQQAGYQPFTVKVTNSNNCYVRFTDSVYLKQFSQIQANITYTTLEPCPGTSVGFTASPSGGTAPYTLKWNNLDTGLNYTTWVQDSLQLLVKTSDLYGCSFQDTFPLVSKPRVYASIIGNPWQCYDNGLLKYKGNGILGKPPYTYNWFGLGNQKAIYIDPSSDTTLVFEVTDSNGCQDSDTMSITRYIGPPANAGSDQIHCGPSTVTLQALVDPAFTASYNWIGLGSGARISYQAVNSGYVHLEVSDSMGCRHFDSVYIKIHPKASIQIQGTDSVCEHDKVTLNAIASGTPPFQISWAGGPTNISGQNYSFKASQSGWVYSFLSDSNDCADTASLHVEVFPFDTIVMNVPASVFCENQGPLDLKNWASPAMVNWSGNGVKANTFYPDSAGVGQHLLFANFGIAQCSDKDSVLLEIQRKPQIDFEVDVQFGPTPLTVSFTNKTQGNYQWFWNLGVSNKTDDTSSQKDFSYTFTQNGSYSPRLLAYDGVCRDSLTKTDYIETWPTGLYDKEEVTYQVYPNPFSQSLSIANPNLELLNWVLYAADGKLVKEGTVSGEFEDIDTCELAPGLYLIRIDGVSYRLIRK